MAIENHGKPSGFRTARRELVLEVIVVLRPAIDVRAGTGRRAEAAQVVGAGLDPGTRETRRDVPVAPGVLGDAMYQEQMCARDTDGGPAQRA